MLSGKFFFSFSQLVISKGLTSENKRGLIASRGNVLTILCSSDEQDAEHVQFAIKEASCHGEGSPDALPAPRRWLCAEPALGDPIASHSKPLLD